MINSAVIETRGGRHTQKEDTKESDSGKGYNFRIRENRKEVKTLS